jgi:alkylation response protein AidB-like acyl-CoA dehydrogenase
MIDADVVADLRRSFAAALAHEDPAAARAELLKTGWLEALELDEDVAVALVFREQGRTGRDAGALDDVMARCLAGRWPEWAGDLAIAHPVAPGAAGRSHPTHVVLPGHGRVTRLLWVSGLRGEELAIVALEGALAAPVVRGIDPSAGWIALRARPAGNVTALRGSEAVSTWERALAAGRVAVAHQLTAAARELLGSATAYAKERKQFGSAIAAFQAVKHRLAETLVAISAADAAAVAAASTRTSLGAAIAKVLAGRAAAVAAKNCLQVFAGIGFTTEHDFYRRFRRSLVLDRLLGDWRTLERELGAQVRSGMLRSERVVELDHVPRLDLA